MIPGVLSSRFLSGGKRLLISAVVGALMLPAAVFAADANSFVYGSNSGTTFKVTPQGLSTILVGGRVVAKGGWYATSAEPVFGMGSGEVKVGPVTSATLKSTGADKVTVTQQYKDVRATFDYTFSGDTVDIRAKVENNHPDKGLWVTSFEGLVFDFGGDPKGILMSYSDRDLKSVGMDAFYPSKANPIGGSAAIGYGFGVGLTPANPRLMRTLFDWAAAGKLARPLWMLKYIVPEIIPFQGARTYTMKMKVANTTDWKTLMQPYRDYFKTTFGGLKFTPDFRPVAVATVKSASGAVTKDNPYGYSDPYRRFDKPEVVKSYLETIVSAVKKANCQALIFRGLAGYDSKGLEWLPYFNNLPPEIDTPDKPDADGTLKQLRTALTAEKINPGVTGQPNAFDERVTWTRNEALRLNPEDPAHLDAMWQFRIKYFLDRGVTAFNFENFGSSFEDVKIMKFLREKMGEDKQTFVSEPCDMMLLYSGAYVQSNFNAQTKTYKLAMPDRTLEALRWLVPNAQVAIKYSTTVNDASGESPVAWTFRNHMIPMLPDNLIQSSAEELRTMETNYLNDKWQWLE